MGDKQEPSIIVAIKTISKRTLNQKKKKRNEDNFVSYDKDLFNKQLINYTSYAFSNTILICHSCNVLKILIGKK